MAPSADYFPPAEPLFANSLKSFGITRNAFLPETAPVTSLSHSYYQPWESIVKRLPSLIDEYEIQAAVQSLSVLSCSFLSSEAEWRRAYVLLGFMAHAYIWGGEEPEEVSQTLVQRLTLCKCIKLLATDFEQDITAANHNTLLTGCSSFRSPTCSHLCRCCSLELYRHQHRLHQSRHPRNPRYIYRHEFRVVVLPR